MRLKRNFLYFISTIIIKIKLNMFTSADIGPKTIARMDH